MDPIIQPSPLLGSSPSDPAAAGDGGDDTPQGVTVEERDEFWRKRLSGHQKGWNAERQALRDQIASLEARTRASATGQGGQPGNGSDPNAEIERLQREIEQRDLLYGRKVKYPSLNGNVSDAVIAASTDAELARLNALFDDTPPALGGSPNGGGVIAPTQPRRTTGVPGKRIEDMTKDELLVELRRESDRAMEARRAGF